MLLPILMQTQIRFGQAVRAEQAVLAEQEEQEALEVLEVQEEQMGLEALALNLAQMEVLQSLNWSLTEMLQMRLVAAFPSS